MLAGWSRVFFGCVFFPFTGGDLNRKEEKREELQEE
jgi:hypothetical protein